jgi:hypothetical protein
MRERMSEADEAELWWSKLTPETQELLVTDPRRHLEPDIAGEVHRAGLIPESEESQGEVRTLLPPDAIEFVLSKSG